MEKKSNMKRRRSESESESVVMNGKTKKNHNVIIDLLTNNGLIIRNKLTIYIEY